MGEIRLMKKIILIPDSFKGTMSSSEVCSIMKKAILNYFPDAKVLSIPVADGGEGSVDAFLSAVGGKKVPLVVKGPYFEDIPAFYGVLPDGTAVIEMAAAAGLPLVGENRSAGKTTTFGVGQLIAHAAKSGCHKIIVGLGGSATNDGGAGAAAALGIRFLDEGGHEFVPVGETLGKVTSIDTIGLNAVLKDIDLITMCDIDNPLCGPHGAAAVFGPQKGASEEEIRLLDQNLSHLAEIIQRDLGKNIRFLPGSGAAGGMGGGMTAFFDSRLQAGIETVLDIVGFDDKVRGADLVFSGEGKLDSQSLRGKVIVGVARRTKKQGVPLIAIVGDIGDQIENIYREGVSAVFSINRVAVPFSEAKQRCKEDLALTMDNLMRFFTMLQKHPDLQ
ncbi:D-glycerate kinase [Ruminococcaceae bacterium BL-4]|jgi:glycerate kinase|nr:D-glycerate kinase [Ruminococcaceae bacterium BL-4]